MRRVALLVLTASAVSMPAAAWAQVPGHADSRELTGFSVLLARSEDQPAPPPVPADNPAGDAADPQRIAVRRDGAQLQVTGIGFRGLSAVEVQVGNTTPLTTRADETGTISVTLPAPQAADPGTSVVATGIGPAGGARTITGAVPPRPFGPALMTWVRWAIAGLAVLAAIAAWQRWRLQRRDLRDEPPPTGQPVAGYPMPPPLGRAVVLPPPAGVPIRPPGSSLPRVRS